MKYNLSKIMLKAWKVYRKTKNISFAEALHRAWLSAKAEEINAKRIEDAKHAAGIAEETNTFAKWKELGYRFFYKWINGKLGVKIWIIRKKSSHC